jgi:hypothetical protein
MNIETLKNLIVEGNTVLETEFTQSNYMLGEMTYVNSALFDKWYEKVKIFLTSNNYEDSIAAPSGYCTNYDTT